MDPYDADWWISRIGAEAYYEAISHGPGHIEMGGEDNAGVSSFASYPGSMSSFMRANPGFEEQVRVNTHISERMTHYAKFNYYRTFDLANGTMTEKYFNVITMSEGFITHNFNYILNNKTALQGWFDANARAALDLAKISNQLQLAGGYTDINISVNSQYLIGGTAGIQIGTNECGDIGMHPYGGLSVGSPGISASITYSEQNISSGLYWGAQWNSGGAMQTGQNINNGAWYFEVGAGISLPTIWGFGVSSFYVF